MKRDHIHNYVLGINGTHIYLNIFWTKEMLQIDQRQMYMSIFSICIKQGYQNARNRYIIGIVSVNISVM